MRCASTMLYRSGILWGTWREAHGFVTCSLHTWQVQAVQVVHSVLADCQGNLVTGAVALENVNVPLQFLNHRVIHKLHTKQPEQVPAFLQPWRILESCIANITLNNKSFTHVSCEQMDLRAHLWAAVRHHQEVPMAVLCWANVSLWPLHKM